jgi:hypothetical protein
MKQVKGQDDDRDRFIEYLKLMEGVEYETVDVDVKLPSGKDFDYLLESSSGESLALEITRLPETQEFLSDLAKYYEIRNTLEPLFLGENLSCGILITIPAHFFFSMGKLRAILKDNAGTIASEIIVAAQSLTENEHKLVKINDSCYLLVNRCSEEGVTFRLGIGHRVEPYGYDYFYDIAAKLIPEKNQQLYYEADRRVLFIGNTCYMAYKPMVIKAMRDFIQASSADVGNIDEIYIDFSINKIERVYLAVA